MKLVKNVFLGLCFSSLAISLSSCWPYFNDSVHESTVGDSVPIYYKTIKKAAEIKWETYTAGKISFLVTAETDCGGDLTMLLILDGSASLPTRASLPSDYVGFTSHSDVEVGVKETRVDDVVVTSGSSLAIKPGATYKIDFIFRDDYFYVPWSPSNNLMRYDGAFLFLKSQNQGDYAYFMPENRRSVLPGVYYMHYDSDSMPSSLLTSK